MAEDAQLLRRFGPAISELPRGTHSAGSAPLEPLKLYADQRIATYYAPFDFINESAQIAIVGVTPGPTQFREALEIARDGLAVGMAPLEILASVKAGASFKGMRRDLAEWLDALGVDRRLGLDGCAEVFEDHGRHLLHTTSAIRYPTFYRRRDGTWQNYSGASPAIDRHVHLRSTVLGVLGPELRRLGSALVVPLGKANVAVQLLCDEGVLDPTQCLIGMPHPSPASPYRHRYFTAAKRSLIAQLEGTRATRPTTARNPRPPGSSSAGPGAQSAAAGSPGTGPPRSSRSRPTSSRGGGPPPGSSIVVTLTQGNISHAHVYLRSSLDFFPRDAIGPAARSDGLGTVLTLHFDGLSEPVVTDIAGGNKLFFRDRRAWREFFSLHRVQAGDAVRIERLGPYEYRVARG